MGLLSWMPAVLLVVWTVAATEPQSGSSVRLSARWVGQDGHDYVGPTERPGASDIQDIHIALSGLDPAKKVAFLEVRTTNGNYWQFGEGARHGGLSSSAKAALEPLRSSSSRRGLRREGRFTLSCAMSTV